MEVIGFTHQKGIFVQVHFATMSVFCEPSIPTVASDDPAYQKRRSVMNAGVGSIECGELEQACRIISWMVESNTAERGAYGLRNWMRLACVNLDKFMIAISRRVGSHEGDTGQIGGGRDS